MQEFPHILPQYCKCIKVKANIMKEIKKKLSPVNIKVAYKEAIIVRYLKQMEINLIDRKIANQAKYKIYKSIDHQIIGIENQQIPT